MNMTTKQFITLLLMTLTLVVALALLPETQEEPGSLPANGEMLIQQAVD